MLTKDILLDSIKKFKTDIDGDFQVLDDQIKKSRDSLKSSKKDEFKRKDLVSAISIAENLFSDGKQILKDRYNKAIQVTEDTSDLTFLFDQDDLQEELVAISADFSSIFLKTKGLVDAVLTDADKNTIVFINLDYTSSTRVVRQYKDIDASGKSIVVDLRFGLEKGYKGKQIKYRGLDLSTAKKKSYTTNLTFNVTDYSVNRNQVTAIGGPTIHTESYTYMDVTTYNLLGGVDGKRYTEISIYSPYGDNVVYEKNIKNEVKDSKGRTISYDVELWEGVPNAEPLFKMDVLDEFAGFNDDPRKCKLIIAGHGGSEADTVQSDAEHDMKGKKRYDLTIVHLAQFIKNNINSKCAIGKFTIDSPLPITFMSCQSAGIDAFNYRAAGDIDLKNTMAGRLISNISSSPNPIYAHLKARTTNVASVKTEIRSDVVKWQGHSQDTMTGTSALLEKDIVGTPQVRRGLGGVKDNRKLGFFFNHETKNTNNAYGKDYGVQGKEQRIKGYKYAFYYIYNISGNPEMKVIDLSDKKDVDPIFEVNKDRLIQYIYGMAYYVYEKHDGFETSKTGGPKVLSVKTAVPPDVQAKKTALLNYLYDIEKADSRIQIRSVLDQMSKNPSISKHLGFHTRWSGDTRTVKIIKKLIELFTAPQSLIPLADLDSKGLGLL